MSEKVITLPGAEEMLARLIKVSDIGHAQEQFYPLLLEHAGTEKVAEGVTMMLVLAICDYTAGLPPMMAAVMFTMAPRFIDALVDDKEVAEQAKAMLQQALAGTV